MIDSVLYKTIENNAANKVNDIVYIILLAAIAVFVVTLLIFVFFKENYERKQRIVNVGNRNLFQLTPYEFEEFVAEYLKSIGFINVDVTPKSGDYGADIIAVSPTGEKTAVQCKLYSSHIGVKAVQEVNAAKDYYRCKKAMVIGTNSYTSAAEKMAARLNVELVTIRQNSIHC